MSELSPTVFRAEARVSPPGDVQAAVSVVRSACRGWQPVAVQAGSSADAGTVEAGVCGLIDRWPPDVQGDASFVLGLAWALSLVGVAVLLAARSGWQAFWRTRLGWWLRHTYERPWHHIVLSAMSTGAGWGLMASPLGVGGAGWAVVWWCALFGFAVGAVWGVKIWRWQLQANH